MMLMYLKYQLVTWPFIYFGVIYFMGIIVKKFVLYANMTYLFGVRAIYDQRLLVNDHMFDM